MKALFKILLLPVWLPFKILWVISRVLALCIMMALLAGLIYFAFRFL